jgi:hypothetical protein
MTAQLHVFLHPLHDLQTLASGELAPTIAVASALHLGKIVALDRYLLKNESVAHLSKIVSVSLRSPDL